VKESNDLELERRFAVNMISSSDYDSSNRCICWIVLDILFLNYPYLEPFCFAELRKSPNWAAFCLCRSA
jgi:hypothetical protein